MLAATRTRNEELRGIKVGPVHGSIVSNNLRSRGSTSVSVRVQYAREYAVFRIATKTGFHRLWVKYDGFAEGE